MTSEDWARPYARRRFSRRRFATLLGGVAGAGILGAPIRRARAQDVLIVDPETEQRTETIGESQQMVWVEATGHTMSSVLLDYWRVTGREQFFGNPISEPFETAEGVWSQVMERGVIEYLPELMWTLEPFVRFMPAGRLLLGDRITGLRGDGKRMGGGGNARSGSWALPEGSTLEGAVGYTTPTGVAVADFFNNWYSQTQANFYLGKPLTELVTERGKLAQWFEGGLLLEDGGATRMAPLGEELARRMGIDTTPVAQGDLPLDNEALFLSVPNPAPVAGADAAGPGRKRIDVNITQQQLTAYAGDTPVLQTLVSTGMWPNPTEQGHFRIRFKKRLEDMRGAATPENKVVWVAGDGGDPPPGSIPYGVPDVPDTMYINLQAEALHGAYWHNSFGQVMSHGCINLPLEVASFLYEWAPLGTPVEVFLEPGMVYPGSEGRDLTEGDDNPVGQPGEVPTGGG